MRWNRNKPYDESEYCPPEDDQLARQLIKAIKPQSVAVQEEAIRQRTGTDFSECVTRVVDTKLFTGSVTAEYRNEDDTINPGYEKGTTARLIVAGSVGRSVVYYYGINDGIELDRNTNSWITEQRVTAMKEALRVIHVEDQTGLEANNVRLEK